MDHKYEIIFHYDGMYFGVLLATSETGRDEVIRAAVDYVWESNGIDVDLEDVSTIVVNNLETIGEK